MSERVGITLTLGSKMIEIPIGFRHYKNRVCIEIMADIFTESKTEDEAGKASEDIADDLVRYLEHQIRHADGCPGVDEVQISTWGVQNLDIEEREEE